MKGTALGLLTASVFFLDGVLRKGAYFGARFERYFPGGALHHDRLAVGMSLTGAFGALGNYLVAENFSKATLPWTEHFIKYLQMNFH